MLFPTLDPRGFVRIDLDALAREWLVSKGVLASSPNPLIDPVVCMQMIRDVHASLGTDHSYGGWMEDRAVLWRDSYLDKDKLHLHLGIDWNVPEGTPVAVDQTSTILHVDCDTPEEYGWGTRIILRPSGADVVLVFAHLAPLVHVRPQDEVPEGTVIGTVGSHTDNGGWYPHLHVQAIRSDHYEKLAIDGLCALDGYGSVQDRERLTDLFPDPSPWLRLSP